MKLSEILAISGQPGLYKFVAQNKGGIIVESLADGKRMPVQGTSKVSSLGDIAVFTETEDMPLADIFQTLYEKTDGKEAIDPKSSNEDLKSAFRSFIPTYDEDRVHVSDMKKIFSWYNILLAAGLTSFKEEAEGTDEGDGKEDVVKNVPTKQAVKPVARKNETAPRSASASKAPKQRSAGVKAK